MTPREFILEHALTQFAVGGRSMSFVDILRESANSRKSKERAGRTDFWSAYKKLVMLLNSTLASQGLPRIPFSATGIFGSLSNGWAGSLSYKVLLRRFGVAVEEEESASPEDSAQQASSPKQPRPRKTDALKKSVRSSRVRFATEKEFRHAFSLQVHSEVGAMCLSKLVLLIKERKRGFWSIVFDAFTRIEEEFQTQYNALLPTSQSMVGRAINGGSTITREDFVAWVESISEDTEK